MEFLVDISTNFPEGMDPDVIAEIKGRERERGVELMAQGQLCRIWRHPGRRSSLSLYEVADANELHGILSGLPQFPWMDIQVTPLADHPLDVSARAGN